MPTNHLKDFNVLFVEDETTIRENIAVSLGYLVKEVKQAENGQAALEIMDNYSPDLIITDLEMPIMGGIEFVKEVRKDNRDIPIVVLTAHTNQEYLIELIDMHIEHFIVKPMNFDKLLSVLQKCESTILASKSVEHSLPHGFTYDWDKKRLLFNCAEIKLTKKEIAFLELLFKNSRRVVSYEEIEQNVWEDDVMTENSIRSLVRNLRRKLPENLIENLSGIGYKLA